MNTFKIQGDEVEVPEGYRISNYDAAGQWFLVVFVKETETEYHYIYRYYWQNGIKVVAEGTTTSLRPK